MIRRVKHEDIDRVKYQNCIKRSFNYRIYAEDWYLDLLTDKQWDCLVLEDYEVVMPLPYVKKLGVKIIVQPVFVQQLGVFGNISISETVLNEFSAKFESLIVGSYQFNSDNDIKESDSIFMKDNYLLNLNISYQGLYSKYRKDRKKDIRRIEALEPTISHNAELYFFLNELISKYPHLNRYYKSTNFKNFLEIIISKQIYDYLELEINGEIISTLFIIHSHNRRIVLLSSRSQKSEYKGAFAYLVDYYIKNNAEKELILDFEGSMIANIADFNRSFGALKEVYPSRVISKISIIKQIVSTRLLNSLR